MAHMLRHHPADDAFDDPFRGFFMRPVRFEGQPDAPIRIDVSEDEKGYVVHAELPGARKEDIHVTVEGGTVAISAEVKKDRDESFGHRMLRSERPFGKLSRSFSLAQEIDETAVSAKYVDGVLELQLPKRSAARSRRIAIG